MEKKPRIITYLTVLGICSLVLLSVAFSTTWSNLNKQQRLQGVFVSQVNKESSVLSIMHDMQSLLIEFRHGWDTDIYNQFQQESHVLDATIAGMADIYSQDEEGYNQIRRLSWFNSYQEELLEKALSSADTVALYSIVSYVLLGLENHAFILQTMFQNDVERISKKYDRDATKVTRQNQRFLSFLCLCFLGIVLLFVRFVIFLNTSLSRSLDNLDHLSQHDWSVDDLTGARFFEFEKLFEKVNYVKKELHGYFLQQQQQMNIERELATVKMQALRAQVNPHFLFNALHQIGMASWVEPPEKVMKLVEATGKILRYSLDMDSNLVPYSEEMEVVKKYIFIQQECHIRKIVLQENATEDGMIIPMTIQPIVENCMKHGFQDSETSSFVITVSAYMKDGVFCVDVRDNGKGFVQSSNPQGKGEGIGLENIQRRLLTMFGSSDLLKKESILGQFTKISLQFPQETLDACITC